MKLEEGIGRKSPIVLQYKLKGGTWKTHEDADSSGECSLAAELGGWLGSIELVARIIADIE